MLTEETVKSSAIEGERLDAGEVRSSIGRRLGLDVAGLPRPSRQVEGVVEMMLDATRDSDKPLTAERLFGWHAALFPTGRSGLRVIAVGAWRNDEHGPMQVVSGPVGRQRVHFEAPAAERLEGEMADFIEWFNAFDTGTTPEIDPVLRAGVAHFRFITIHPFDDGNGRIARAIGDMALAQADGMKDRYYSMSSGIEAEREDYHRELASAQSGELDITAWLMWFFGCLDRTIDAAGKTLEKVRRTAVFWQDINRFAVNERQRKVIGRMLDDFVGHLTTSKYAKLAKCSNDTALRDIKGLLAHGIIVRNTGGGRSTSYRLAMGEDGAG